jgi:hypothetical protein
MNQKAISYELKKFMQFLSILLVVAISGCSGLFNMKDIKGDIMDDGFSSVVMLKLKITDKTNVFYERSPQILLTSLRNNNPTIDWISGYKAESWTKKDNISYYENLIIAEAKPAAYLISTCNLTAGDYSMNIVLENKGYRFTVKPGEIIYLGTLEVLILNPSDKKPSTSGVVSSIYDYTAEIKNAAGEFDKDIAQFKKLYPQLSRLSDDKINSVRWK